jgi:hypothetical protein
VIAPTILGLERTKATQGWHQEKRGAVMLGEGIPAGMPYTFEDAESVDAAIADALKSQKNRQTGSLPELVQNIQNTSRLWWVE